MSSIEQMDVAKLLEGTTPGPWKAGELREIGVYGCGYRVAVMTGGELGRDLTNARLIAAAPRLAREHIEQAERIEALTQQLSEARQYDLDAGAKALCKQMGGHWKRPGDRGLFRLRANTVLLAALAMKGQSK